MTFLFLSCDNLLTFHRLRCFFMFLRFHLFWILGVRHEEAGASYCHTIRCIFTKSSGQRLFSASPSLGLFRKFSSSPLQQKAELLLVLSPFLREHRHFELWSQNCIADRNEESIISRSSFPNMATYLYKKSVFLLMYYAFLTFTLTFLHCIVQNFLSVSL